MTTDDRLRRDLATRVMARVAAEPHPTPARALRTAIRSGSVPDALASLASAWRLATLRGRPVALGTRARSMALALGVGGALATSGAVAFAGALDVAHHVAAGWDRPLVAAPAEAPPTAPPTPPEEPSPAPSSRPVVVALPTPDAQDRDLESAEPTPLDGATDGTPPPAAPTAPARTPRPTDERPGGGADGGEDPVETTPRPTATSAGEGESTPGPTASSADDRTPEPTSATTGSDGGPDSSPAVGG